MSRLSAQAKQSFSFTGLASQCALGVFALLAAAVAVAADTTASNQQLVEIGQRIFRQGILSSGQPLQGQLPGGVSFSGAEAACIKCHRRSGLGSVEGGNLVLPITGTALYQPGPAGLWQKFDFKTQGNNLFRPAYTDSSLGKAIREGITPTERALRPLMPRFTLGDDDIQALIAYLKTLSNSYSGYVDGENLHLATVIAADADLAARKAMLDVIEAYLKEKNTETRSETRRRQTSKEVMYTSYRKLDLQVWELQGAPETWEAQLQEKYRQRPVFALVSGLGGQQWQPVHDFCEHREVPCLFPNSALAVPQPNDFFSVYFSRGVALEADVLAKYLTSPAQSATVLQVYRDQPQGNAAAAQFRQALQAAGQSSLKERKLAAGDKLDAQFWSDLLNSEQPAALVLWLNSNDIASIDAAALSKVKTYLSASMAGEQLPKALQPLNGQVYLLSELDTAEERKQRVLRTRVWLQTRQVPFSHEVLQANTFWTLLSLTDAIKHLGGNFSPAYLVERLEDMTQSLGVTSIYPRLSLGAGQRFAAKSARVLQFSADGKLIPASEWSTP